MIVQHLGIVLLICRRCFLSYKCDEYNLDRNYLEVEDTDADRSRVSTSSVLFAPLAESAKLLHVIPTER